MPMPNGSKKNFAPCHKIRELSINRRENNAAERRDRRQQLDDARSDVRKRRLDRREHWIEHALRDRERSQGQNTDLEYIAINILDH
jgi:hypothetical protein